MYVYKPPQIYLYKKGDMIVVWYDNIYHQYWDYSIRESLQLFKKKYNITGKHKRVNFCPFIFD